MGTQRRRVETRFQIAIVSYSAAEEGLTLSRASFTKLFDRNVSRVRRRRKGCGAGDGAEAVCWLARGLRVVEKAGAAYPEEKRQDDILGEEYDKFEVLVRFCYRIRVASSSARLSIGERGWIAKVDSVPGHGVFPDAFAQDCLSRWSKKEIRCFGTGLHRIGIDEKVDGLSVDYVKFVRNSAVTAEDGSGNDRVTRAGYGLGVVAELVRRAEVLASLLREVDEDIRVCRERALQGDADAFYEGA